MKSVIPIQDYLKVVNEFNIKYPGSHVGGSIGLFLHGIDLKRPLTHSDLDITFKTPLPENFTIAESEVSSCFEDFDTQIRVYLNKSSLYIKVDINVKPDTEFDIIKFEGFYYNVSKKENILEWKRKYALKGIQKHIDDLSVIGEIVIPAVKVIEPYSVYDDNLPF